MSVQPLTCQHIDFNCWLDNCPVRWVRAGGDNEPVFVLSLEQIKQLLLIFKDAERWYKEIPDLVEEDFENGTFDQWESNWAEMERLERQLRQLIDPTLAPATAGDHQ